MSKATLMVPYRCDECFSERGDHFREATVPEVIEWLREHGIVDYEAADDIARDCGVPEDVAEAIVAAALRETW